jgi:hypothetical protein
LIAFGDVEITSSKGLLHPPLTSADLGRFFFFGRARLCRVVFWR